MHGGCNGVWNRPFHGTSTEPRWNLDGTAVSAGWKEKHAFVLDEPGFEKYRANCDVKVEHVDKAANANTNITAQWVPPGAPRLRSSVSGGSTAELDARDVDEPETHQVPTGHGRVGHHHVVGEHTAEPVPVAVVDGVAGPTTQAALETAYDHAPATHGPVGAG